jgi:hypothetical protein
LKSHKLPSIQFYPGDWKKDPGVQSLPFHDRGVWFEIMLLMHESTERGKLLLNGKPMPNEALARQLGLDNQILESSLTKILDYGVASKDENGALINRRMVRDEEIRKIHKKCGKMGGNPALVNQMDNQTTTPQVNQKPTPSSSSSSSSSSSDNTEEVASLPAPLKTGKIQKLSDEEWLKSIEPNYPGIDVPGEIRKMSSWLTLRPTRKMTRRFVLNWLNNADKVMSTTKPEQVWSENTPYQ